MKKMSETDRLMQEELLDIYAHALGMKFESDQEDLFTKKEEPRKAEEPSEEVTPGVIMSIPKLSIPKVINGSSANTLYFLINNNTPEMIALINDKESRKTPESHPMDPGDFGRCYEAYKKYNWTADDLHNASLRAIELDLGMGYMHYIQNFEVLAKLYEDKQISALAQQMFVFFPKSFWKSRI